MFLKKDHSDLIPIKYNHHHPLFISGTLQRRLNSRLTSMITGRAETRKETGYSGKKLGWIPLNKGIGVLEHSD